MNPMHEADCGRIAGEWLANGWRDTAPAVVEHPQDIAWHLDQALHLATSGRPDPIWLGIPIDAQG